VRVGDPRLRALGAADEVAELRARHGPEPERSVDVQPGAVRFGRAGDCVEVVEGAGVHLAGLGADDRRRVAGCERPAERFRVQPSLRIRWDDLRRAEAEQA
jgi:hypothetical protein